MSYPTERLTDLRDAITAELEGRPWEVYQRRAEGVKVWSPPSVCMAWYLENTGSYFLRPKREPKAVPWSRPEHVPGPVCWIRPMGQLGTATMIVGLSGSGFVAYRTSYEMKHFAWSSVRELEYSTDRVTWLKCEVVEP